MAKYFSNYKMGALLSLIGVYFLVILSANSVEATSREKVYKNLQASHASNAAEHDCIPVSCRRELGDEIDPRYGVEKRLVPTGPNPLHH